MKPHRMVQIYIKSDPKTVRRNITPIESNEAMELKRMEAKLNSLKNYPKKAALSTIQPALRHRNSNSFTAPPEEACPRCGGVTFRLTGECKGCALIRRQKLKTQMGESNANL